MKPQGVHREELVEEGIKARSQIRKLKDEIKSLTKSRKDKVVALEARIIEIDDELEGRIHQQTSIPLTRPRSAGETVAARENGAPIPDGEVREAKEQLRRKRRRRAGDAAIDVTPKALPPRRHPPTHHSEAP